MIRSFHGSLVRLRKKKFKSPVKVNYDLEHLFSTIKWMCFANGFSANFWSTLVYALPAIHCLFMNRCRIINIMAYGAIYKETV